MNKWRIGPTVVERCYNNPGGWNSCSCDRFGRLFFRRIVHFVCLLLRDALGVSHVVFLTFLVGPNIASSSSSSISCHQIVCRPSCCSEVAEGIAPGRPGFWLLLTVVYSAISAFFLPRLFAGQTFVIAVRAVNSSNFPLAPTMANLTQSIYLIADFICFILIYGYARDTKGRLTVGNAAVCCVILNLIFAGLDIATYATGTTELLAFIRNANYALLSETELAGSRE